MNAAHQIGSWLGEATSLLEVSEVPTARLDSLILLEDALGKDRAWLLAHPDFVLGSDLRQMLGKQIERRAKHEPLAYIRGKSEFYGREFKVNPATLQPRPETETMITLLKKIKLSATPSIVDIGTGSGAIAITAKLEWPEAKIYATEINNDALAVAEQNAHNLQADIQFYEGDLLEPLQETTLDVILANLPYVPDEHTINQAAMQEPRIAIFGGKDGLDLYREMFEQINKRSQKPIAILSESLPFQHEELKRIARLSNYTEAERADFIQMFKLR